MSIIDKLNKAADEMEELDRRVKSSSDKYLAMCYDMKPIGEYNNICVYENDDEIAFISIGCHKYTDGGVVFTKEDFEAMQPMFETAMMLFLLDHEDDDINNKVLTANFIELCIINEGRALLRFAQHVNVMRGA